MVQYLNALQSYQDDVTLIQNDYKSQMELYEAQADVYQAEMEEYQKARLKYETARNSAVQQAEGVIESITKEFGWAWVNKHDPQVYRPGCCAPGEHRASWWASSWLSSCS
jgi:hypothetical protein